MTAALSSPELARAQRRRAAALARKTTALRAARLAHLKMKAAERVLAEAQVERARAAWSATGAGASLREVGDVFDGIEKQTVHALVQRGATEARANG